MISAIPSSKRDMLMVRLCWSFTVSVNPKLQQCQLSTWVLSRPGKQIKHAAVPISLFIHVAQLLQHFFLFARSLLHQSEKQDKWIDNNQQYATKKEHYTLHCVINAWVKREGKPLNKHFKATQESRRGINVVPLRALPQHCEGNNTAAHLLWWAFSPIKKLQKLSEVKIFFLVFLKVEFWWSQSSPQLKV